MFKAALIFTDRVGIVADISALLARRKISIQFMEVEIKKGRAHVYLQADNPENVPVREEIAGLFGKIEGIVEIRFIDTLPHEERENRFRVVLDNVSDGVLSIDTKGRITTINSMAQKALECEETEMIGRHIRELNPSDHSILECLKGKKFSNTKKNLIGRSGRFQYLATGRPIKDTEGRIIGAVEIAKGVQEIKRLAKTIVDPVRVSFGDIIGRSPLILEAISFANKIAKTEAMVSIRGSSGTGKELFARAIHTASQRPGTFVPINCAALPEQLLESELFGYSSGAFTGGRKEGKPGLFEIAGNGTVFLDEIAEMPGLSQAKILRVIQDRRIRRIGGSEEIPVNTRIITASNRNLEQLVEENGFRKDLYYRINVLPIHIPPLTARLDDIPLLVEHFLFRLANKLGKPVQTVSEDVLDKLGRHDWPGNVRELKNVVERASILSEGRQIEKSAILFSHEIGRSKGDPPSYSGHALPKDQHLKAAVADVEKRIIMQALNRCGSIRKAAESVGISHPALINKIKKYGVKRGKTNYHL